MRCGSGAPKEACRAACQQQQSSRRFHRCQSSSGKWTLCITSRFPPRIFCTAECAAGFARQRAEGPPASRIRPPGGRAPLPSLQKPTPLQASRADRAGVTAGLRQPASGRQAPSPVLPVWPARHGSVGRAGWRGVAGGQLCCGRFELLCRGMGLGGCGEGRGARL